MKLAVAIALVFVVLVQIVDSEEEWKCTAGVPYIENDCNGCFCTEKGVLGCTEKGCVDSTYKKLFDCQVGTTSQKDCNKCVCVKGSGTICTNHKC